MSRTDVHRPWHVQMDDPYNRHRLRLFQQWPMEEPVLVPLYSICGCWMCGGGHERREQRRRDRHRAQQICRDQLKESNANK